MKKVYYEKLDIVKKYFITLGAFILFVIVTSYLFFKANNSIWWDWIITTLAIVLLATILYVVKGVFDRISFSEME